jgi:predicted amidohydrolase YtcJ
MTGGFRTECQGMAGWADLLFVNAQAFTTDTRHRVMEAVATRGKSILTVGTTQENSGVKRPPGAGWLI